MGQTEHDERDHRRLLERLLAGDALSLVSDGGLPCISDPGRRLVSEASRHGVPVTVLPGPTAVTAAVAQRAFGEWQPSPRYPDPAVQIVDQSFALVR